MTTQVTPNMLSLIFDGGLAVLLIVTIAYCARLSRRIRIMQDTRGELATMIARFDQATGKAMTTLAELQAVAKRISEALQLKIDKANFLADDLAFLIEKSTKLSQQMDQQAKAVRPEPAPQSQTLKPKLAAWTPRDTDTPSSVTSARSLEALLSKLAASGAPAATGKPAASSPAAARTSAERELIEAVKPGR